MWSAASHRLAQGGLLLTAEATLQAEDVQCGSVPKEEAGWPTKTSPKGIEVLRQSTAPNVFWLSIYIISLSCILFFLKKKKKKKKCVFLEDTPSEAGWGKEELIKNKLILTYVKVLL